MTKVAVVGGVVVVAGLCFLGAIGFTAALVPVVTAAVIVIFIAGGNWLHGWSGTTRSSGPPASSTVPPPREDRGEDGP
jgi:hypothetical protein